VVDVDSHIESELVTRDPVRGGEFPLVPPRAISLDVNVCSTGCAEQRLGDITIAELGGAHNDGGRVDVHGPAEEIAGFYVRRCQGLLLRASAH
jgi:hypothetical protein